MLLDIRPDHLDCVKAILTRWVPDLEVWAFGSRAKWTAKDYSDLDLCIVTASPLPFAVMGHMEEAFSDSDLPYKVDLVDWSSVSAGFREVMERDKVVVQIPKGKRPGGGGMSSEWRSGKLGDFIELKRGYDLPQAKRLHGPFPLVSSSGISDCHSEPMVRGPGVITGRYGTIGQVYFVAKDFWPLNTTLYVRDFKGNDPKFISYFLKTVDFFAYSDKAAVPGVNRNHLHEAQAAIPDVKTQEEIASFLGVLDDRITLLRETNATLEAIAQALFKSWFVDFDPVYAKQQGIAPAGMDDATAALFPDGFEESALGLVPKGWRLVPFGQLLSHTIGGDWGSESSDDTNSTKVAIIRGTDMPDLQSGAVSRVPIRYTNSKKLATRKLEVGDIILEVSGGSRDQPTGRSFYIGGELLKKFDCPVEPASFCRLLRPNSPAIGTLLSQHLTFIYAEGKTWEYQNQSTGIANFQTTHFLASELVAIPSDDVLNVFADIIQTLMKRTQLSQINNLATLRDTLLPRLISGQLRLPEAEEQLAEAIA